MKQVPLWRRYTRMFGADAKADVRDELQFHIEAKIDALVAHRCRAAPRWSDA